MSLRAALLGRSRAVGSQPTLLPAVGRRDLAALSRQMGWTHGAEIGVWKGEFSAALLEGNPQLHLLCVDPWQTYADWQDGKNGEQRKIDKAHQSALARLAGLHCTVVRKFSAEAAEDVPDGSLDFIYVDANHGYDAVINDLTAWSPKVKRGGGIFGHDYRVFRHKPAIEVVPAVQAFTKAQGIAPWFVLAAERTPSFGWEAA